MANAQQRRKLSVPPAPKAATHVLAGMLMGAVALSPLVDAKSDEVVRTPSGIAYVTGGVSSEAIERLEGMERDFNLKIVFATTSGAYLSDVKVAIVDAGGRTILDTTTEGPVLMARLVAGGYQINASFAGQMERQTVTLGAGRLSTIGFRWVAD